MNEIYFSRTPKRSDWFARLNQINVFFPSSFLQRNGGPSSAHGRPPPRRWDERDERLRRGRQDQLGLQPHPERHAQLHGWVQHAQLKKLFRLQSTHLPQTPQSGN